MENMKEAPNGIYLDRGELFIGSWANGLKKDWKSDAKGRFFKIDLMSKKITNISSPDLGNLDGVTPFTKGSWLVSDKRANKIFVINEKSGKHTPLNYTFEDVADIHYSKENKLIAIPLMKSGKLVLYPL